MKKNKKIIVIAVILCLLAALVTGGLVLLSGDSEEPAPAVAVGGDTDWYDENGKEFLITTVEELYGLAELSKTYSFKGQTVKLGGDIVINEGNATQWATRAPEYLWNPVTGFAGTFDGQGYTISGVYGNSIVTSLGLFTDTQKGCVIKNLNLVNSCFKNNNDMGTGSIIGVGGGVLENVYSDAVMVSAGKYVGGLIGCVKTKGENQIINCWFDGTITMDGYDCSSVGGLVGAYTVEDAINTIAHCLSTADIICMGENVGGICGNVGNGSFLNLTDSMFTGTLVYDTNKYAVVGSVIGQVMGSASVIVNDSYTVDELANRTIGTSAGYQKGSAIAVGKTYLLSVGGYQWTTLDFDNYWVVQKDGMPRLRYYTQATESIDGVEKMVDISWYDQTGAAFEITNVQQLYGFAYLSRSYDFRGQTIKLGADITVNEGDAETWGENAPAYNWTPIAWYGSSLSQRFKGTFDGQGHTISGIYAKGTENITCIGLFGEVYHGAVVKNFKLVNSYFEGVQSPDVRGPVGSVSGRLRGTIENVYSDAIVVNSAKNTGGIVGMVIGTGQNRIAGCWFDGTIYGITRTGGILGGVYGNKGNIEATIEHCLNTGDIHVEIGQAAVGGICGSVETWSILYVDDCLNAGTFRTFGEGKKASAHIGTLVGTVTQTDGVGSKAVITHSYGTKEFYSRLVGWKYTDKAVTQSSMMYVGQDELIGYGGYRWTTLDFKNHWAVRTNDVPVPVAFAESRPSVSGKVRMVDYSWYDPDKSVYTIRNFQQLYGMARLWEITNLFKGKTVRLGADITINKGSAADWAENAPAYIWEPVKFRGTFDGQGHTISGVYVKGGAEDNYIGFFHRIYKGATVKNLKITNSYFEGTMDASKRGAVGSLTGRSNGIIDTVYSDAIVVNSARMTGGLVGMITGEGENKIRNSWFDGQVTGINRTGGILGGVYGNKQDIVVSVQNCVNTGNISVKIGSGDVGGICGIAETGGTLYLTDCLNAGTFQTVGDDKEPNTHIGSVFGSVTQKDTVGSLVVLNNVYGVQEFYSKLIGWKYGDEGISASAAVMLDMDTLTAPGGYQYTALDFENAWGLNEENVPVPAAFAVTKVESPEQLDYSWYDAGKSEYVITTAAQLKAFNILCNAENKYFAGKTVKLGADIVLTGGSETAPNWIPITFSGIFDGQGHSVSGVYVKTDKQYNGFFHTLEKDAVVQDLKLVSSYIEGAYTGSESRAGVGSIVGRNRGTVIAVYSNATVVNSKNMTGGIAGMSEGGTISNCWFDGEIYGGRATGGILGGTYAKAATIEHCLNTGTLNVADNSYYVGGICGELQNASTAVFMDCLNAGTLSGTVMSSGAVVGRVDTKASLAVTDVYGIEQFQENVIGACTGTLTGEANAVRKLDDIKGYGAYQWTTLDFDGGTWVLKMDAVPVLGVFDSTDLSLDKVKKLPDFTWYDEAADTYIITTVRQIYGMNVLAKDVDYFKGKVIKLGADITFNEGDAAAWAAGTVDAPDNVWTPVNLSGTFDGQGHTISGLYVNSTNTYTGLFGTVNGGAVVQDLKLVNSYIEGDGSSTRSGVGSIAGRNHGTIDTVYTNAILKNNKQMTGGISGMATSTSGARILNCWFDGTIYAINGTGGILGCSYGQKVTIEHCLNTGTMHISSGKWVGGLCGYVQGAANVTVKDSLNAGTLHASDDVSEIGAIAGRLDDKGTLTLTDAYGVQEFAEDAVGYQSQGTLTINGSAVRKLKDIKGYSAYQRMALDFDGGTWVLKKDAVPVLGAFGSTDLSLEEAKKLPDLSWYDENSQIYVITTAQQLFGFNSLCTTENNYFKGKTVKLGADITLNEGKAADWTSGATDAPNNIWTPVNFGGTFDGQGYTISGLYVNSTKQYAGFFATINSGAIVKDLKLVNSYIAGNGSETRSGVGSIAGRSHGTIDTIYTDAILKNNKQMTGGIVGMVTGSGENTITNCWFDGTIYAINGTGGILGSSYGQTVTIEHCLNTGALNISSGSQVGGLCGYVQGTANVTVSDSLNAGTLTAADGVTQIGTVVGSVHDNATLTLTNAYGVKEFAANAVGYLKNGTLIGGASAVQNLNDIKNYGAYQWTALDFAGGYWVMKKDAIPLLGAFATADLTVEDAEALPDYSWYDEAADTYVITTIQQMRGYAEICGNADFVKKPITLGSDLYVLSTAEQLRAFAAVCGDGADFAGKTVQLGADIVLNDGSASDWAATAPANAWEPISFGGTFDGNGKTVSGLYVAASKNAGFFSTVNSDAVVKDLILTNSYIQGVQAGSIAGCNKGTIGDVHSSAIVNGTQMAGGIAGTGDGGIITNCWFDGAVTGANAGGILGGTSTAATVENCLNTGSVTGSDNAGGLIGHTQTGAAVSLGDSLNAGALGGTATSTGALVGTNEGTLTVAGAYGIKEFAASAIGTQGGAVTGSAYAARNLADIQGYGAYQWTTLDFDGGIWVLKDGAIPTLSAFNTTDLDLAHAKILPDYNWYLETGDAYILATARQLHGYALLSETEGFTDKTVTLGSDEYIITTAEQLRAINALSTKTDYFTGKTVKLGANIDLGANTTDWAATPAANKWTPLSIKGTFDGQGYTISGAYVKAGSTYVGFFHTVYTGATVKNLKLVDSYIENTKTSGRCGTGSIAGRVYGTIDSTYSSAIVKNGALMTGGIAGMSFGGMISNCWFDGQIHAVGNTGGILGGSYDQNVTIEHCLNTGTIRVDSGTAIGGLCGYVQAKNAKPSATIKDSLNVGTFVQGTGTIKQVGTIIGAVHASAILTVENVYGVTEFKHSTNGELLYGYAKNNVTVVSGADCTMDTLASFYSTGAAKLSFGTYWTARDGMIPVLKSFSE